MIYAISLGFVFLLQVQSVNYLTSRRFVKGSIVVTYFRFHNNVILQCVAGSILLYTSGIAIVSLSSSQVMMSKPI